MTYNLFIPVPTCAKLQWRSCCSLSSCAWTLSRWTQPCPTLSRDRPYLTSNRHCPHVPLPEWGRQMKRLWPHRVQSLGKSQNRLYLGNARRSGVGWSWYRQWNNTQWRWSKSEKSPGDKKTRIYFCLKLKIPYFWWGTHVRGIDEWGDKFQCHHLPWNNK